MKCVNCGFEMGDDDLFCGQCGQRVVKPAADQPVEPVPEENVYYDDAPAFEQTQTEDGSESATTDEYTAADEYEAAGESAESEEPAAVSEGPAAEAEPAAETKPAKKSGKVWMILSIALIATLFVASLVLGAFVILQNLTIQRMTAEIEQKNTAMQRNSAAYSALQSEKEDLEYNYQQLQAASSEQEGKYQESVAKYEEQVRENKKLQDELNTFSQDKESLGEELKQLQETVGTLEKERDTYKVDAETLETLASFITLEDSGYADEKLFSSDKVLFLRDNGEQGAVTITDKYNGKTVYWAIESGDSVKPQWGDEWKDGTIQLYFTPQKHGMTMVKIYVDDIVMHLMVVVL